MFNVAREELRDGRRRVGAKFLRSRKPSTSRRVSEKVPEYPEDDQGQAPGPAREPGDLLPHEDAAALRVRKAPAGARVGRGRYRGQNQRDLPPADILAPVPAVSPLLPSPRRPVQGQVTDGDGERRQTSVEVNEGDAHEFASFRKAVNC